MKGLLLSVFLCSLLSHADCIILDSQEPARSQSDALFVLLKRQPQCPTSVQQLSAALARNGLVASSSMVANRGRNNPGLGSFSFFEQVTGSLRGFGTIGEGEVFFGHFTGKDDNQVYLDQTPDEGKLLIEALGWDIQKKLFNFYELIGAGKSAKWFYRGDSADILKDNALIYREVPNGVSRFGNRLRCSACHASGGPIMKEQAGPHNDWWTHERPLIFKPNRPSKEILEKLNHIEDASAFSRHVQAGIEKLEASPEYVALRSALSLQEQLRPLFCENEINLESDLGDTQTIHIPSAFFVNPFLSWKDYQIARGDYLDLLAKKQMRFPETDLADADHAWLTPVKGYSDLLAIETLIKMNVVDRNFVMAVLSIDSQRPIFSSKRCDLLKLVPNETQDWLKLFKSNLNSSRLAGASELLHKLNGETSEVPPSETSLMEAFEELLRVRISVQQSEISQNPRGSILEPGFRVIFPEPPPK